MKTGVTVLPCVLALLAPTASADSTLYTPVATGFTPPNAQQAVTATSLTGTLDGAQITGNITNVGVVRASGNIVAGGNVVSMGYVNGNGGLYSGNGVYATDYYGRGGGANANFAGNASSATSAATAGYAASSVVGILRQTGGGGDLTTYFCDSGYHLVFFDTNVDSTNNAFFPECIQDGH
jgi:hypothetical protein